MNAPSDVMLAPEVPEKPAKYRTGSDSEAPLTEVRYMSLGEARAMFPGGPPLRAGVTISFASEALTDEVFQELAPLNAAHWQELAYYRDIPLDPDLATYRAAAAAGLVRLFTIRAARMGALLGYSLFFVQYHPHCRGSLQANQDVIYLDPSIRGRTGPPFIAWCDRELAAEGVQVTMAHVKASHDFGAILERQGYELMDKVYAKRLD